ncbi:hypothetical protein I5L01_01505 [Erythrobacter sp. YJ-T3-07]|uniref:hypothetical protein n=1 Tax=Erythrobacter sp. YJ-T3-07 TaxID=2793063 RepID=UPI0018D4BF36|nr:hypothetical protein [Erythrobacter sp. YJ-T3-07]MBH1942897.1 hypothetical protein [Erythrobacter sp. YJ-T3-07]
MKRRAFLGSAIAVPLALAGGAVASRRRDVRWLDLLDERRRRQVLAGNPDFDVAESLRKALESLPDDGTLDARDLTGVVDLASDPFPQTQRRAFALRTGEASFRFDFNQGPIALPSHVTWQGEGTRIEPVRPIEGVLTDASPAAAMVATAVAPGLCSAREGSDMIELSHPLDAQSLVPGMPIAIFGLREAPSLASALGASIGPQANELSFAGDVASTIGGSLVYLRIGEEIVLGTVSQGRLAVTENGRGALGTQAAAHRAGETIVPQLSFLATIAAVSGTAVRLDRKIPRSFARAPFRAGTVGSRMAGRFAIDGGYQGGAAGLYSCLASTLSSGFVVEGEMDLARASHGGFMGFGCSDARIALTSVAGIGRPKEQLGGSIWLYGSARGNRVSAAMLSDGNGGIFIDDKSYGVSRYALEGPSDDNTVSIGQVVRHRVVGQISGSSGNAVTVGLAQVSDTAFIVDRGGNQSTAPLKTERNTVEIGELVGADTAFGDALGETELRGPLRVEQ